MHSRSLTVLASVLILTIGLQGCFVIIEEDDRGEPMPTVYDDGPQIINALSYWTCDYSSPDARYFFEFQAVVDDPDGWRDVIEVNIYFFETQSARLVSGFSMHDEGEGTWGGMVWEDESAMYCGEPMDVIIEAIDQFGERDSLEIIY
ncbi:MAG: hypothetical protein CMP23_06745 [Rickettsiales bacterium]|nr:hypothetical protein [Rickettsiales bacterium]|tara:strand:+ start:1657 stop:2097 length:441 start_codon:yes stop_codon:yes gene_type:complete